MRPPRQGDCRVPVGRLRAWAQLLRLPNLLTVPGDPIAGFLLAQASGGAGASMDPRLPWAAAASLALYCAGLLANDYFDLAEDRRDRPARPLPAGMVRPGAALAAAIALAAAGVGAAAQAGTAATIVAAILAATIFAYDAAVKKLPLLGPLAMGACRGLSLLVGAAAASPAAMGTPAVALAAGGLALYVAAVTSAARGETSARRLGWRRWAPVVALLAWLPAVAVLPASTGCAARWACGGLAALAVLTAIGQAIRLGGLPAPLTVQRAIGGWIGCLLLVQAALAASTGPAGLAAAAALAGAFAVFGPLARRFHAS